MAINMKQVFCAKEWPNETHYTTTSYFEAHTFARNYYIPSFLLAKATKNERSRKKMVMATNMDQIFRMKEGTDETSYAKSSYLQKQVLSLTKHVKENSLREFFYKEQPRTICIADLGCSSAELNTLDLMYEFIDTIEKENEDYPKEYQIYLNDLPRNDFNTIFRSLGSFFDDMLKNEMRDDFGRYCFVNGVPGSFYGRLFPSQHLHFVHSSYSLHWLSQAPKGIEDNKRNIYIARTSPPNVLKAYYDQYDKDFSTFLKCRSKEVVAGGKMVLTILGRNSNELYSKESCYLWDFLAMALNDMVNEGFIEEEKLNTFNVPMYSPSAEELSLWVEKEGSFNLNQVHISEVSWKTTLQYKNNSYKSFDHGDFAKCMRAVMEPLVVSHFGEAVVEEVFRRYAENVRVTMAKERKNVFINVTISLTRKG